MEQFFFKQTNLGTSYPIRYHTRSSELLPIAIGASQRAGGEVKASGRPAPKDYQRAASSATRRRMASSSAKFRVLTLNTWVGDYRRGYASRDTERLRWIESQVRAVPPG